MRAMKKIILILSYLFLNQVLTAQTYKKLQQEAEKEFELAQFPKALELSKLALKEALSDKKISADDLLTLKSDNAVYLIFNEQVDEGLDILYAIAQTIDAKPPLPATEIYFRKNFGTVIKDMGLYNDALPHFKKRIIYVRTTHIKKRMLLQSLPVWQNAIITSTNFLKQKHFIWKLLLFARTRSLVAK